MKKISLRQITNILAILLALAVNILASALPLNGQNTGEISDRFKVLFVPAGYVFSIWGVIYIGWLAFGIFQASPTRKDDPRLQKMGFLFALSCLFNAAWLVCWHYNQFGLSVLVMLSLLGLLIACYLKLNVGRTAVGNTEKWCVDIPFSVYLGWITVAAVANVTDWLYLVKWNGFGLSAQAWAITMLVVALLLGMGMALTRRDAGYLFVLAWSFVGIALKQASEPLVSINAWTAALLALALAVFTIIHRRRFRV